MRAWFEKSTQRFGRGLRASVDVLKVSVVAALVAAPSGAETLADVRPDFLAGCLAQGNEAADCACMFDSWAPTVPEAQNANARAAIMMFLGQQPATQQEMMAGATLLQSMMGVLMQCALGGASLPGGFALPGASGLGEALQAIPNDAATPPTPAKPSASNRDALTDAYETELERIHSRQVNAWPKEEFQTLFGLYCERGGGEAQSCTCAWEVLSMTADTSATAYLASRSEGDDVLARLSRDEFTAGLEGLDRFNSRRAVCDG